MPWFPPLELRSVRLARKGVVRALRGLLFALLVLASMPAGDLLGALEATVGATDRVAHVELGEDADVCGTDCADDCAEDGCTPLNHHCRCCAPASAVPNVGLPAPTRPTLAILAPLAADERSVRWPAERPPLPPPIS